MTEKVCRNCGASFMGRSNQNYCSLPECRKASIKASDDKYKGRKRKKQEATVNNSC